MNKVIFEGNVINLYAEDYEYIMDNLEDEVHKVFKFLIEQTGTPAIVKGFSLEIDSVDNTKLKVGHIASIGAVATADGQIIATENDINSIALSDYTSGTVNIACVKRTVTYGSYDKTENEIVENEQLAIDYSNYTKVYNRQLDTWEIVVYTQTEYDALSDSDKENLVILGSTIAQGVNQNLTDVDFTLVTYATPSIPDGSLTLAKFSEAFKLPQNRVEPTATGEVDDNYYDTPTDIQDDLNKIRTQIKNVKGTTNWDDFATGVAASEPDMNKTHHRGVFRTENELSYELQSGGTVIVVKSGKALINKTITVSPADESLTVTDTDYYEVGDWEAKTGGEVHLIPASNFYTFYTEHSPIRNLYVVNAFNTSEAYTPNVDYTVDLDTGAITTTDTGQVYNKNVMVFYEWGYARVDSIVIDQTGVHVVTGTSSEKPLPVDIEDDQLPLYYVYRHPLQNWVEDKDITDCRDYVTPLREIREITPDDLGSYTSDNLNYNSDSGWFLHDKLTFVDQKGGYQDLGLKNLDTLVEGTDDTELGNTLTFDLRVNGINYEFMTDTPTTTFNQVVSHLQEAFDLGCSGFQELGLVGKIGSQESGLTESITYYYLADVDGNGLVEYNITPGAGNTTITDIISDLNTSMTESATWELIDGDIRLTSDSTGIGSSISLSHGKSGLDIFTNLNGFSELETQVDGIDVRCDATFVDNDIRITNHYIGNGKDINIQSGLNNDLLSEIAVTTITPTTAVSATYAGENALEKGTGWDIDSTSKTSAGYQGWGFTDTTTLASATGLANDATSGYQEISSSPLAFVGATVPGILSNTYSLNISINGNPATNIFMDILVTDSWTAIINKIDAELSGASASIESDKLRITSSTVGTSSSISIAEGTSGNGLIAAIDAITDMTATIESAVAGTNGTNYTANIVIDDYVRVVNINGYEAQTISDLCSQINTKLSNYASCSFNEFMGTYGEILIVSDTFGANSNVEINDIDLFTAITNISGTPSSAVAGITGIFGSVCELEQETLMRSTIYTKENDELWISVVPQDEEISIILRYEEVPYSDDLSKEVTYTFPTKFDMSPSIIEDPVPSIYLLEKSFSEGYHKIEIEVTNGTILKINKLVIGRLDLFYNEHGSYINAVRADHAYITKLQADYVDLGIVSVKGLTVTWEPGLEYDENAIVQYNGEVYISLEDHTSGSTFESDKYHWKDVTRTDDEVRSIINIENQNILKQLEKERHYLLELAITQSYLLGRQSSISDLFIENFLNEDNTLEHYQNNVTHAAEIMDDNDWNNNWKERNGTINFKNGFIRPEKQKYMLEEIDRYTLESTGAYISTIDYVHINCISRFDTINECYWVITNTGPYHDENTDAGVLHKIDKNMKDGQIIIKGRWYLNSLNDMVAASEDYNYWSGVDVTPSTIYNTARDENEQFLFLTFSNGNPSDLGTGLGKLIINSDNTLGRNHVPPGGLLTWDETWSSSTSDFTVCEHLDRVADGNYYRDCTVWEDHIGVINMQQNAGAPLISIEFYQMEDDNSGNFLTTTSRNTITGLEIPLYVTTTSIEESGISLIKQDNNLWVKYSDPNDNRRVIVLFNVAEETSNGVTKYIGDIKDLVSSTDVTGNWNMGSSVITGVSATTEQWDNMRIGQIVFGSGLDNRTIVDFDESAQTITISSITDVGAIGGTINITGVPNVLKTSGRFDVAYIDDPRLAAYVNEGISVSHDGHLLEISYPNISPYRKTLHKRAITNALWSENQVDSELSYLSYDKTNYPATPVACMIENNRYFWTGDATVTANEVDLFRYDSYTTKYYHCRLTGASWTAILDLTTDGTNIWLLGYDGTNFEVYFDTLSNVLSSMGEGYDISNTYDLTTGTLSSGIGAANTNILRGICYNEDDDILYLLNDTDDKIDTLSVDGVTWSQGVYDLPASVVSWRGIAYKNNKIYISDCASSTAQDRIYGLDKELSTDVEMYRTHIYQDPCHIYDSHNTWTMDFYEDDLVVMDLAYNRFLKVKTLEDPDVLQLNTFLDEYNILISSNVTDQTPIVQRYFEPEDFTENLKMDETNPNIPYHSGSSGYVMRTLPSRRNVPDMNYMALGYGDGGFSVLHLDKFLSSKTSTGKNRYNVKDIRCWHFEETINGGNPTTGGGILSTSDGNMHISSIVIERDFIVVGASVGANRTSLTLIDLKNGSTTSINVSEAWCGYTFNGTISERNEDLGYSGVKNLELSITNTLINRIFARTFTKDDISDYNGEHSKTFLNIGNDGGLDIIVIDWDANGNRVISQTYKNVFNYAEFGRFANWIAPSGKVFAGEYAASSIDFVYGVKPVWELNEHNGYDYLNNQIASLTSGDDPKSYYIVNVLSGYAMSISPNSYCWRLPDGTWRHRLLIGTMEDSGGNGRGSMQLFDVENESMEMIRSNNATYYEFNSVDNFEDLTFGVISTYNGYIARLYLLKKTTFNSSIYHVNVATNDILSSGWYPYKGYLIEGSSRPYFYRAADYVSGEGTTHITGMKYSKDFGVLSSVSKRFGLQLFYIENQNDNSKHLSKTITVNNPVQYFYKKSDITSDEYETYES